ncbi:ribonucleoside-diphosphate reductase subunit alpha [Paraburkholderia youngii]|uniref:ribonucleoside-diphosphate reductase subunit alpha n=1 Tax=Paraburkholderia youngii TaxID=2782701 RepID=UPI003D2246C3
MNNDLQATKSVIKRDGSVTGFDPSRIRIALMKNAIDVLNVTGGHANLSQSVRDLIDRIVEEVTRKVLRNQSPTVHIEDIQDQVELALMRAGERALARGYVVFRDKRAAARNESAAQVPERTLRVTLVDGTLVDLDKAALISEVTARSAGLDVPAAATIVERALMQCYDAIPAAAVRTALLLSVREQMEMHPDATYLAASLRLADVVAEVAGKALAPHEVPEFYQTGFRAYLRKGVANGRLDEKVLQFDIERLIAALKPERDRKFDYLGIETVADRYLVQVDEAIIELPQWFYMRVAMGHAFNEINREERAIEFYDLLSQGDFMSSTPTLFNAATCRSQLSSCYLTTIADDLESIYGGLKDNALLSKFAGGLGNDWTNVRALGSHIKGTNGKSQGIVPFLKVVNDTAVAVNQGGKRKGAVCAYLETWHLDLEEFLDLRKNTGDDRRRTHDMNTANWVPDLFMKRVMSGGDWTLFSPSDVPDLHDLFGTEFEAKYTQYEADAAAGRIKLHKTVKADALWRKMLGMLFETGHPWITFKDPCNSRSPQQHVGRVHSSNLCTEITLNTSETEIAVCNLGSVNLVAHLVPGADGKLEFDLGKLERTVGTAMRMLDNVIDLNYYAVAKARNSNLKHRPVGLGKMGFQDALHEMGIAFGSQEMVEFADASMEYIAYFAYKASNELAKERGAYSSFKGSLWDKGILPQDSFRIMEEQRGFPVGFEVKSRLGEKWDELRTSIQKYGMRNSNCLAIAPTATISNIVGVSPCIEQSFSLLFAKSNLGGEFTVVNRYLVQDLKALGLWDAPMVADLKHYDGCVAQIERVPEQLRAKYATAFETDPAWSIEGAARRTAWIDQSQSLNIYVKGASGKLLDKVYKLAWTRGLKTTYYLRTQAASSVEKSTGRVGQHNAVPVTGSQVAAAVAARAAPVDVAPEPEASGPVCMMRPGDVGFEDCEACQ